jgi:predicted nucleotidyltransferase
MKTIEQTEIVSEQDKALLGEVKRIIQALCPAAEVLLYGSVAKGTQGPESDYDILVLTDEALSKVERNAINRQVLALELDRNVILSTIYHSKEEWDRRAGLPFHGEVEKYGVLL